MGRMFMKHTTTSITSGATAATAPEKPKLVLGTCQVNFKKILIMNMFDPWRDTTCIIQVSHVAFWRKSLKLKNTSQSCV